jgi:hypothetical protein
MRDIQQNNVHIELIEMPLEGKKVHFNVLVLSEYSR